MQRHKRHSKRPTTLIQLIETLTGEDITLDQWDLPDVLQRELSDAALSENAWIVEDAVEQYLRISLVIPHEIDYYMEQYLLAGAQDQDDEGPRSFQEWLYDTHKLRVPYHAA